MMTSLSLPPLSYADWSIGIGVGDRDEHHEDHHFYRWHEHPRDGYRMHFLPGGYETILADGGVYYYYDGLYYIREGFDYVLVSPPIGAYVTAIPPEFQPVSINGRVYYTDDGVYYVLTHHGYKVVPQPVVYVQPQTVVVAQPGQVVVTAAPSPPPTALPLPPVDPQDSFTVNVPNNSGEYTSVVIKKSGSGYVGPQGEFYAQFPTVTQLKAMYTK